MRQIYLRNTNLPELVLTSHFVSESQYFRNYFQVRHEVKFQKTIDVLVLINKVRGLEQKTLQPGLF